MESTEKSDWNSVSIMNGIHRRFCTEFSKDSSNPELISSEALKRNSVRIPKGIKWDYPMESRKTSEW